jgi:hypothetical protein
VTCTRLWARNTEVSSVSKQRSNQEKYCIKLSVYLSTFKVRLFFDQMISNSACLRVRDSAFKSSLLCA